MGFILQENTKGLWFSLLSQHINVVFNIFFLLKILSSIDPPSNTLKLNIVILILHKGQKVTEHLYALSKFIIWVRGADKMIAKPMQNAHLTVVLASKLKVYFLREYTFWSISKAYNIKTPTIT